MANSDFTRVLEWTYGAFFLGDQTLQTETYVLHQQVVDYLDRLHGSGNWQPETLRSTNVKIRVKRLNLVKL